MTVILWLALQILVWGVLALLTAIVLLAALPLRIALTGEAGAVARLRVTIGLMGGMAPGLVVYDSARPRKPRKKKARKKPKRRKGRTGKGSVRLAGEFPVLLRGLLRQIRFEEFRLQGRFGLGDPADTGTVFGMLSPILYGLPARRGVTIALAPDFDTACLDGQLRAALRITPITLLPPILRFVWRVFGPMR
ncbi:DUF2953 domain-containing protein [Thalassovita aquimarina]|uniref:DUF2953 domain-containing protein n=1 Tax=Thalassovita aquimarina TaxID=2785917 RepID=A0ABS5HTE1_9RHOB|nr:DUF2953 domain-containing protein [Thalassovita aquimarina]